MAISGFTGMNDGVHPGTYRGNRAQIVQPYDAANIKLGFQFELSLYIPVIAAGASFFVAVEVGDTDIIIKNRAIDVNGGLEYRPWRGATYTKGSLIDRVENLNGKSTNTSKTLFYNVTGTPTLPSGGDYDIVKSPNDAGTNRSLGQFPEGIERVVPAGGKLLLEFKNTQSQDIWVVFKTSWYEGTLDFDWMTR